MGRGQGIYLGLFLISASALMLEVALTRLLSIAFWHHFAFLVISIALFGIAASGTYLTLRPGKDDLSKSLSKYALLYSISITGGYIIINTFLFDPFRFFVDTWQILIIMLYYLLLALPFFFTGLCIAKAFTMRPGDAGKLYSANLLGSGVGALVVPWLFAPLGGAGVVLFTAALGILSSMFFNIKTRAAGNPGPNYTHPHLRSPNHDFRPQHFTI